MGRIPEEDDNIMPIIIRSPSQGTIQKPNPSNTMERKNSVIPGRASFAPNVYLTKNDSYVDAQMDFSHFSQASTGIPAVATPQEVPQLNREPSFTNVPGHNHQPSFVVGSNSVTVKNPIPTLTIPSPGRSRSPSQSGGGQQAFRQSVARVSVAQPQYDPLDVLAEKFNMPELAEIATRLTVEQVSLMDVMEAEQCGISRDSYFKLKRYFISKRKL